MLLRSLSNSFQTLRQTIIGQSWHIAAFGLIALIGLAWVATNSNLANAQSLGNQLTFNTPDPGEVWFYQDSEQVNVNLAQSYNEPVIIRVLLCVADAAGTCSTNQAIADYLVTPGSGTNHTLVWPQVGHGIDGDRIEGNFEDNAQLLGQIISTTTDEVLGGGVSPVFSIEDRLVNETAINITDPIANDTWVLGGQEPIAFTMTNFPVSPSNPAGSTHTIKAVLVTGFVAGGYFGSGFSAYRYDLGEWQLANGSHTQTITVPSEVQITPGFPVTLYVYAPDFEGIVDSVIGLQLVSGADFLFDTSRGISGFEFEPLVFDPSEDPAPTVTVKVWLRYTGAPGTQSVATTLRATAGFGTNTINNLQIPVSPMNANSSRLVTLGTFPAASNIFQFNLLADSGSDVAEVDEANNVYAGGGTAADPGLNTNTIGTLLHLGALDNPASPDIDAGVGEAAIMLVRVENNANYRLPAGEKVLSGRVTLTYDPVALDVTPADVISNTPGLTASYNLALSSIGTLVVDVEMDKNNYPTTPQFEIHWKVQTVGDHEVAVVWSGPGVLGDGTDLFVTDNFTPGIYGDTLRAVMPPSGTFIVHGRAASTNTYYSAKFTVATNQSRFVDLDSLTANFNTIRNSGAVITNTTFALGFFNAAGANLCAINTCASTAAMSFDSEGYLQVSGLEPNVAANLSLDGVSWQDDVAFIQVKIFMTTSNPAGDPTAQPWVQSVEIAYDADDTAPFILTISPTTAQLDANASAQFQISAVRLNNFSDQIALTDDVLATFGANISNVTYSPAATIPADSTGPVTITLTAASAPTAQTDFFNVTGSAAGASTEVAAQVVVGGGSGNTKTINLELTVPIEGGHDGVQPVMAFRLYNAANQQAFAKADVLTNKTTNKVTLSIPALTIGEVYRGFIRSTRHLWQAADTSITIQAATDDYTMSFVRLFSGDLDPNNFVNSLDFPVLTREWGRSGTGIIPDIDANGAVNSLDVVGIVSNWFKAGVSLPTN